MALKDIINNAKYADDMVIELPDKTTMTVGEMRALNLEEKQALATRNDLLQQAEVVLATRVNELKAAGLLDQENKITKRQEKEIRQAAAAELGLDENDPLLGPVVTEMRKQIGELKTSLETVTTELKNSVATVAGVVKTAVQTNLDEHYAEEFGRAQKDFRLPANSKVKYEDVYKFAESEGLKDKAGRFDLYRAYKYMTIDDQQKAFQESTREQISADQEKKNRLASINRPSAASPSNHRAKSDFNPVNEVTDPRTGNKREVTKSFDEALSEAMNDDDLLASAFSAAALGTIQ